MVNSKMNLKEVIKLTGLNEEFLLKHTQDKTEVKVLLQQPEVQNIIKEKWLAFSEKVNKDKVTIGELFAGAGGLAIGFEKAGLKSVFLNEFNNKACATLRKNRPLWNIIEGDIRNIDFSPYKNKIDILSGGFPCQAFSHAGKRLGFADTRGTLFYEFARVITETNPKAFVAENVKGLLSHDNGSTIETIKNVFTEIGYTIVEIKVLNAMYYNVPQKRERIFIIGIRNDLVSKIKNEDLCIPCYYSLPTMKDVLFESHLYPEVLPLSNCPKYPKRKKEIMDMVPQGGYWRNLPIDIQKEYMQKSFYAGGGKTGMARRLSLDEPCLTLTCSPSQKQTERCHPLETRPLSTREYARIQTFPDDWFFEGSVSAIYQQIGNAVPVNLGFVIGKMLSNLIEKVKE